MSFDDSTIIPNHYLVKLIPILLIYFRLLAGLVILVIAMFKLDNAIPWIIGFMLTGFFSDILDGMVARKLGTSSVALRQLDSIIDRIFWLLVLVACYILYPDFIQSKWMALVLLLTMELLTYLFSLIKFSKTPAPHNLLSKLWGVTIVITLIEIIVSGSSGGMFNIMIYLGILSRFDSLIIHILLKEWDHDIPSFYHAYQLRNGKSITRNGLLNG